MAEAKVWNLALIPSRQHRELSLTPCLVSVLGLAKSWRASYCNSADIARGTAQPWYWRAEKRPQCTSAARKSTLNPRAVPRAIDQRDRVVIKHRRASLALVAALAALAVAKHRHRGDHPLDLPAGGLRVVPVVLSPACLLSLSYPSHSLCLG